ncbi:MAG: MFS transporter, partial [Acutalibacteraceae bacterium]
MDACTKSFQKTKYACYYTYLAMSSVFCLPPILFVTFREMYGISYTLLGTLVLVNFLTQLAIDLVFTFFSRYFNIRNTIRIMPLLTSAGLLIYAFIPMIIPQHAYAGLLAGTVVFSVASGLCEVLLSPLIAALPSDNTERDMSTLHSLYAWGVVSVIIISTVFLGIFGTKNWMYLTIILALLPVVSFVLFCNSPMPETDITHSVSRRRDKKKNLGILLFMLCI